MARASGAVPTGMTAAPVAARMADALTNNYMVNTKIFYAPTVYGHTEAVMDLLRELGVRIIRERITTGTSIGTRNQLYAMPRLAAAGCRWHGTVGELEDWQNAPAINREVMQFLTSRYAPQMGGDLTALMHSFGGCNEIDGPVIDGECDPQWAAHARTMQQALWQEAKAHSATRNIPVAGPSTRTDVNRARASLLGDLSAWSDMGNGHLYNKGTSPTREIDEHLDILRPVFPQASRWIMTETGYNNSPQDDLGNTVPEAASAIYAVRGICDFFKRNTIYGRFELLDDPDPINYSSQQMINQTAAREAHFGLVAMTKDTIRESTPDTWRKKPEFYATKNLLRLLADPGPAFTPSPLTVSVTGGGPDLNQLLLQKRNGKHYLLLWRDVQVYEKYPLATQIEIEPSRLTVQLGTARPMAIYRPNSQPEPRRTYSARTSIALNLRGSLKIIEIG
jgi:hypothetical protein